MMGLDLKSFEPLAVRAVEALESVAKSMASMARAADLQAQLLEAHSAHHDHTPHLAVVDSREQRLAARAKARGVASRG